MPWPCASSTSRYVAICNWPVGNLQDVSRVLTGRANEMPQFRMLQIERLSRPSKPWLTKMLQKAVECCGTRAQFVSDLVLLRIKAVLA